MSVSYEINKSHICKEIVSWFGYEAQIAIDKNHPLVTMSGIDLQHRRQNSLYKHSYIDNFIKNVVEDEKKCIIVIRTSLDTRWGIYIRNLVIKELNEILGKKFN